MFKIICGVLVCWLLATAMATPLYAQAPTDKPPEWTAEEKELAEKATKLNREGVLLYGMGKRKEAAEKVAEALEIRRKLYPKERFKDGHPELAEGLNNMGVMLDSLGESGTALPYYEQALAMRQRLYPKERFKDGHPDLAQSLNNMGYVFQSLGESGKALTYSEQVLTMHQQLYPKEHFKDGHPDLANSLFNLGTLLDSLGENRKALPYFEQALAMYYQLGTSRLGRVPRPRLLPTVSTNHTPVTATSRLRRAPRLCRAMVSYGPVAAACCPCCRHATRASLL
jgi:tetratricopeptide (TPR) repeat protein